MGFGSGVCFHRILLDFWRSLLTCLISRMAYQISQGVLSAERYASKNSDVCFDDSFVVCMEHCNDGMGDVPYIHHPYVYCLLACI